MPIPLAVPVMMLCMISTEPEVDDGAYSTVAKQQIRACTECNPSVKECQVPPEFQQMMRDMVREWAMSRGLKAEPKAEATKPAKRKTKRKQ